MALNGLFCADVPLTNYSLTHCILQNQTSNLSKAHVTRDSSGPATLVISVGL